MRTSSVPAVDTIEQLRKRFKPENARNLNATYLITIRGNDGGAWLTKIHDGVLEFEPHNPTDTAATSAADCLISVDADDLRADPGRQDVGDDSSAIRRSGNRR